jgi:hypothetical protein
MPTLADIRARGEQDIADAMAKLDAEHREMLRDAIKTYGRVQDIPAEIWQTITDNTATELAALYLLLIADADQWTMDEVQRQGVRSRPIDPQGIRGELRRTAGYRLSADGKATATALRTTETMRDKLARKLEDRQLDSSRTGLGAADDDDIDQALDDTLTQERREGIATDGTTQSISTGQTGAAGRFNEPGALGDTVIDLVWVTEGDNKVCPRCAPLEGTIEDVWSLVFPNGPGPEAHPNCRCELYPRARPRTNTTAT